MGCSASKLEDEEVVRLCRERRNFVKQAVEQRTRFAVGHLAYVHSLRQVSDALRSYVEIDEHHHDLFSDACSTPPFTPVKRLSSPEIIGIPFKSFSPATKSSRRSSTRMIHCLRAGGSPAAFTVEERPPPSPETVGVSSSHYEPSGNYGIDGFFSMQSPAMAMGSSSFFPAYSPPRRAIYSPPSPENSHWDFFWNPFSSLGSYGPYRTSSDRMMAAGDEDLAGLRQIREEEGIPELEEEELSPKKDKVAESTIDRPAELNHAYSEQRAREFDYPAHEMKQQAREFQLHAGDGGMKASDMAEVVETWQPEVTEVETSDTADEKTPGFTVYLNRRPTSMAEVMRDIEQQFVRMHESAREVASMLESNRAQRPSSTELTAAKLLNPVAVLRSASFRSSSSARFLPAPAAGRDDEGYETGSDVSDESGMISGSHHSTLERLYAWEKKLYEEVKAGERIRIAYERKCMQLRKQDVNGEDPSIVDRTRRAVRDLQTQLKVSVHSVEAISKRIDVLRDDELCPQLLELTQGWDDDDDDDDYNDHDVFWSRCRMTRMWRTMADCHQIQKAAIDGAKHLLATAPKAAGTPVVVRGGGGLSRPAARLEAELRNWRGCLKVWVDAQRCYVRALTGWLLRYARAPDNDDARIAEKSPLSPPRSAGAPPVFGLCVQWTRMLDSVSEDRALEGLDFFASGIYTVAGQQREAAMEAARGGRDGAAVTGEEEDDEAELGGRWTAPEKMAELAVRVLFAGMSVAVSALAEFAAGSRDAYEELQRRSTAAGEDGGVVS